jgi:hypothetical protein
MAAQFHSFATAVVGLCDQIVGDEDARRWLQAGTTRQVSAIKSGFLALLPIDHRSDLSVLRNRMGGHIDRELSPWSDREILSRKALSSFGKWLHVCLHALLDLLKLDVYSWSVHSTEGEIRLMTSEPFLVTFEREDHRIVRIVAVHLSKRSPRHFISDVVGAVVRNSQWMFESGQVRITSLKVDHGKPWTTFAGSSALWNSKGRPLGA